jgi:transposase InsO family protein
MEFCSSAFNGYCRDEGIARHHTITYTPQHNDVAERMNRTIISNAGMDYGHMLLGRSLLLDKHVTFAFRLIRKLPLRYCLVQLKAFNLWNPETKKILMIMDVVFNETVMYHDSSTTDAYDVFDLSD